MRNARIWASMLGVSGTVVEQVELNEETATLVASVRPRRGHTDLCGVCKLRCPRFDRGAGRRRWRSLDFGLFKVFLEADAPRVRCAEHGVVVASVPWARHDAGHTFAFDDTVAWLAVKTSKTAVTSLMGVAWRTVGSIVARVSTDATKGIDRFADLRRIGIDEISYKRGKRFLTVVVDHDSRRLLWAGVGRDMSTVHAFFDALGEERCAQITHVSSDSATWIERVVRRRCPNAVRCADPFHVVQWAQQAMDQVRRDSQQAARRRAQRAPGKPALGKELNLWRTRHALWKSPENLTEHQAERLKWIEKVDPRLHRAYLLKEGLRFVFQVGPDEGKEALDRWLSWARRSRMPSFVKVARQIDAHREAIEATLEHRLSNALIESTNAKIRVLTRVAFGFKNPDALIGLAMLALGGFCPSLPRAG